jgi:hypothetical protein
MWTVYGDNGLNRDTWTQNHFVPLLLQDETTEHTTIIDVDEPRPSTKTTARHNVRPEKRTRTHTIFDKPKQSNKRMRLPTCTSSPKYDIDATRNQNDTAENTIDPGFNAANTDRPAHKENAGIESPTEDATRSQDDTQTIATRQRRLRRKSPVCRS